MNDDVIVVHFNSNRRWRQHQHDQVRRFAANHWISGRVVTRSPFACCVGHKSRHVLIRGLIRFPPEFLQRPRIIRWISEQ
jgi:hypothetical protein